MIGPTDFGYRNYQFNWGDHICAVFDSHVQQMEIMGEFVSAGIQAGQRCAWVAPVPSGQALRGRLHDLGGDLVTLEASGQLLIISEVGFYLHAGVFEPERTLDLLTALLSDSQREGYPGMRVCNDVSWLGPRRVDPNTWQEFETRVTQEIARMPAVQVCQYDHRQLSASILVAAMRTHAALLLGDTLRLNPFYLSARGANGGQREVV